MLFLCELVYVCVCVVILFLCELVYVFLFINWIRINTFTTVLLCTTSNNTRVTCSSAPATRRLVILFEGYCRASTAICWGNSSWLQALLTPRRKTWRRSSSDILPPEVGKQGMVGICWDIYCTWQNQLSTLIMIIELSLIIVILVVTCQLIMLIKIVAGWVAGWYSWHFHGYNML